MDPLLFGRVKRCKLRGMSTLTFDTLELVNELRSSGIPQEQAEAVVRTIVKTHDGLAKKSDLDTLELKLNAKLESMELRLTIKLGAFLSIAVGVLIAVLRMT